MSFSRSIMEIIFLLSMISVIFILTWDSNTDLMQMVKPFFGSSYRELDETTEPIDGKNIFFLETSTKFKNFNLSVSQACSVESAAKTNPEMQIYLLILSNATFCPTTMNYLNILSSYKNIAIRRITIENYLKNTPMEEWWNTGIMNTSEYLTVHTSDILRLVTLWKFGGIYFDLDMIIMKSLANMTNFAALEDETFINNAAMGFSTTGVGKKLLDAFLQDLKENFKGGEWSNQGPLLITRVIQKICGTTSISDMRSNEPCQGFDLHPTSSFYPIHYVDWQTIHQEANYLSTMNKLNGSFGVHLCNACRGFTPFKFESQSPYATLTRKYCPKMHNMMNGYWLK